MNTQSNFVSYHKTMIVPVSLRLAVCRMNTYYTPSKWVQWKWCTVRGRNISSKCCPVFTIQPSNFAYIRLLNKPYENEVTFTGQNSPSKCCQHVETYRVIHIYVDSLLTNIGWLFWYFWYNLSIFFIFSYHNTPWWVCQLKIKWITQILLEISEKSSKVSY